MGKINGRDIVIKVSDVTICYDDLGESTTPVIFIHGFPFDKSSWKPQMDFLSKQYRVIAYDIRGFGKSTSGSEEADISLFADDLLLFMDLLEIQKAIICGLSMGGYIVLNAVSRYPDRFSAMILSDTQCIADTNEVKEKRKQSIDKINGGGLVEYVDGFVNAIFYKDTIAQRKELVDEIRNVILATEPLIITSALTALARRWETCSALPAITIPCLILCGSDDKITPPEQAEYMKVHIADSVLHLINNSAHMSNLENPTEFNRYLKDFLSGIQNI
ncbi:MAG: alpha/beta hydrolase [Bacteroidota bacterium]